jgi:hypothetical protein
MVKWLREESVMSESLKVPIGDEMLLVDDGDELSASPDEEETAVAIELGAGGLDTIDATLLKHVHHRWQKAARVVFEALQDGGFPLSDDARIRIHIRRLIVLADSGALEATGNLRRPRWSEVRLPKHG